MSIAPVRRGDGPLHLGTPTGSGYRTECGRILTGPRVSVPMPRLPLGRRHIEAHWARCWNLERLCPACARRAQTL